MIAIFDDIGHEDGESFGPSAAAGMSGPGDVHLRLHTDTNKRSAGEARGVWEGASRVSF